MWMGVPLCLYRLTFNKNTVFPTKSWPNWPTWPPKACQAVIDVARLVVEDHPAAVVGDHLVVEEVVVVEEVAV